MYYFKQLGYKYFTGVSVFLKWPLYVVVVQSFKIVEIFVLSSGDRSVKFLIGNGIHQQCLLDKAVEQFTSTPRCAAVETERKLIEVVLQVGGFYRTLIRSQKPAFKE